MIKAVIFDLDDTLAPESEFVYSGLRIIAIELSTRYGLPLMKTYEDLISTFNENPKNVFNRTLETLGIPYTNKDIVDLVNIYRNHFPSSHLYPDVLPVLEQLKSKGIKLGIITDGFKVSQRNKIKALRFEQYFDQIIVTDELGEEFWKPHPKSFEIMKELLDVEYSEMIYVGDNPRKDFYIGCIHPIHTGRVVRNGIYLHTAYFKQVKENFICKDLYAIIDMIGAYNREERK